MHLSTLGKDQIWVGRIVSVATEHFILAKSDILGYPLGRRRIEFHQLRQLDVDDRYLRRLLFANSNRRKWLYGSTTELEVTSSKWAKTVEKVIKQSRVVRLNVRWSASYTAWVTGMVTSISDSTVLMTLISEEGDHDGTAIFPLKLVTSIEYGGRANNRVKLLFENRHLFQL